MKHKLPRWAIYLIGMFVVPLALGGLGVLLQNLNKDLSDIVVAIGTVIGYVCFFALIINRISAIIRHFTQKQAAQGEELDRKAMAAKAERTGKPGHMSPNRSLKAREDILRVGVYAAPVHWGGIILLLILLPPFGIYLLILKTTYEKARYSINSVWTIVIGVLLMLPSLFWLVLFMATSGGFQGIIDSWSPLILFFFIGFPIGLACIVLGLVLHHLGKENDAYQRLILIEEVTDLYRIAERMHANYAHVTRVIERLIDYGILPDAYIFHRDHEVIVPGVSKKIALRCKNCSGTTVLYTNEERICAYCGGKL